MDGEAGRSSPVVFGLLRTKQAMHIVYILRSVNYPERFYIGLTTNLEKRLVAHNSESSTYSKRYSPWDLETHIVMKNQETAKSLEAYLKSGSGFAFMKKRLLPANNKGQK